MANRSNRSVPADAGDPKQRDESKTEAAHDGSDGTIPVGGTSVNDRDNVDSEALIQETKDAVESATRSAEDATAPRSEADFGGSGETKTLKTKGPYMITDPTTGVEVTEDAREVEVSAFLQSKIDQGLIEEA